MERHGRENLGGGLGLQEKQRAIVVEGERRRVDCHRNLAAHAGALTLSEGGAPWVQATGGKKPLAQATGDQALLVQATGGQVLCGLRAAGGVCGGVG